MKARKRIRRLLRLFTWSSVVALLLAYLATLISPKEASWLALFGLGYPLWVILSVISLSLCFIFRRKLLFIPLIALAIGWGHLANFIQWNDPGIEQAEDLKCMSYNVRIFDAYDWNKGTHTRDSILAIIRKEKPDVLCIQEFYHTTVRKGFDLRNDIRKLIGGGDPYLGYTHVFKDEHFYGLATYSKFPIVASGTIEFEGKKNNLCIYTDIEVTGDTIRVYNVHLASIRFQREDYEFLDQNSEQPVSANFRRITGLLLTAFSKRADQTQKVLEHIAKSDHATVLCGDFNDTPVSYSYAQFTSKMNDAFKTHGSGMERSYIGRFPSFRIDYIMHSDELVNTSFRTIDKEFSDHRPVVATFSLEKLD